MGLTYLASFPNSRIKPRAATRVAVTSEATVNLTKTKIAEADANRVYLTMRTLSTTSPIKYGYAEVPGTPPIDAEMQFTLFPGTPSGKGDALADVQSPQEIWAISLGPDPVDLELDVGVG